MSTFDDYLAAPAQQHGQSFDAYLGASQPATPRPPSPQTPSAQASQPGMLASGLVGFGKGLGSVASGIEQLAGKGANAIGLSRLGNYLTADANYGLNAAQQGAAPYEAAHPFVTGAGNVAGQMVGTAPAMAIGPAYAGLGVAGRVGLGAAQGAAGAAMMPTSDQDFWSNKAQQIGLGGLLGGATPLVTAGASAVGHGLWNAVRPVVQPSQYVGEGLAGAMNPAEAAQAAANIRGAQQFVPGSLPTTAQVAGSPVLLQAEKAAANMPPVRTAIEQRAIDNNAARWGVINGLAQTPADMQAAQAARNATVAPLYAAVNASSAPVNSSLTGLFSRPAVKSAMNDAVNLAADEGVQLSFPTAANQPITGQALDYLGRAMRDQIGVAQRSGSAQQVRALTNTANAIDQWGMSNIPEINVARQAYAQGSVPVNTMEAAQDVSNAMSTLGRGANVNQQPVLQAGPYATALARALKNQEFGIDPTAQTALENVGRDLQRGTISNSIRSPGSDTAYNLAAQGWLARQLYGPTFGGAGNVGKAVGAVGAAALGHPMVGLGILGGGNKVGQMVGNRLQGRLADLLMDPNAILPYLDARAAAPAQAVPGPFVQGLLNYGRPAAVNGLIGGFNKPANQ